jgi:hypothetical protein
MGDRENFMNQSLKDWLKNILGETPFTAEAYWYLRQVGKHPVGDFSLPGLEKHLGEWQVQAGAFRAGKPTGKKILVFATLNYWIEHAALMSMALSALGHQVTLAYLPYKQWMRPISQFDLRRQNAYARRVFKHGAPALNSLSFLVNSSLEELPEVLETAIRKNTLQDTQYTLQVENVDENSDLYRLRYGRNKAAAKAALTVLKENPPDVVIVPNGTILEFGAVYQVARCLGLPTVTYEFGEQRQRIWLAQDSEVMKQDTRELWSVYRDMNLTSQQWEQARDLFSARQHASIWENFARRWQGTPSEGGEKVRQLLGLDSRPVVLLATNVIGDSLTLGRQVFSESMTEWLERTARYFAQRQDVQLLARIHPGELVTKGPSVGEVVRKELEQIPENIHLIIPEDKVNTYDLVEIADLGLVYTTTVGMEMVMSGVPVVVAGKTHYREKGFTLDPDSWNSYFNLLDQALASPSSFRPAKKQVEQAWNYAYRFFFHYPLPFPWHIQRAWKDLEEWSLSRVLSDEGMACFGKTFEYLAGEPIVWSSHQ